MNRNTLILIVVCFTLACFALYKPKQPQKYSMPHFDPTPVVPNEPIKEPEPVTPEPEWVNYPPKRQVSDLGKVLSDIESHMPPGHIYRDSDKITWAHETTHGINSHLRMQFQRGSVSDWVFKPRLTSASTQVELEELKRIRPVGTWSNTNLGRVNGFYCLENQGAIIEEPQTTISAAANLVPPSLKGDVFNLYMVQQAKSWNDTPLYVFDEWVAYTNGTACRLDLGIESRAETVKYMLEFDVYALCVAMSCKTEDMQFKNFLKWHLARSMTLYKGSLNLGDLSKSTDYLNKIRTNNDAEELRNFAHLYLGKDWCEHVLGF